MLKLVTNEEFDTQISSIAPQLQPNLRLTLPSGLKTKADFLVVASTATTEDELAIDVISVLLEGGPESWQRVLENRHHDIGLTNLGYPSLTTYGASDTTEFDEGLCQKLDAEGIVVRALVIQREDPRTNTSTFEFMQHFELHFGAFWVGDQLRYLNDGGDEMVLARRFERDGQRGLEVKAHDLRLYLQMRDLPLLRIAHARASLSDESPDELVIGTMRPVLDATLHETLRCGDFGIQVEFCWKQLVHGYDEGAPEQASNVPRIFNATRDEQGIVHTVSCDDEPNFLTPIAFRPDVLTKYNREPTRYTVTPVSIERKRFWSLPYETHDGFVRVFVGDLGKLPNVELAYWHGYNEIAELSISERRYQTDIVGQWTSIPIDDTAGALRQARIAVDEQFFKRNGKHFWKSSVDVDQWKIDGLHVPLTDEPQDFERTISSLALVLCDAIAVDAIAAEGIQPKEGDRVKGSLEMLEAYARSLGSEVEAKAIVGSLRTIQRLRSTGVAHHKGRDYQRILESANLSTLTNSQRVRELFVRATKSMNDFIVLLNTPH